jgi:hypothetical protein
MSALKKLQFFKKLLQIETSFLLNELNISCSGVLKVLDTSSLDQPLLVSKLDFESKFPLTKPALGKKMKIDEALLNFT